MPEAPGPPAAERRHALPRDHDVAAHLAHASEDHAGPAVELERDPARVADGEHHLVVRRQRLGLALGQHAVDDLDAVRLHGHPAALARLQVSTRPAACAGAAVPAAAGVPEGGGYTFRLGIGASVSGGAAGVAVAAAWLGPRSPRPEIRHDGRGGEQRDHETRARAERPAAAPPPRVRSPLPAEREEVLGDRALGIEAEVDRILAHERTLEESAREDVHAIGLERLQEAHADLRGLGHIAKLDAAQLALTAQSFTEGRQPASGRNVVSTGSFRAIWPRNSGF